MKRKLLVLLSVFCVCLLVLSACSLLPTVTEDDPKTPVTTKYTLSFNSNGGFGSMDSVSAEAGTQITLPHCTYTRADHTFVGWGWDYNDEACLSDGDSFTFEAQNTVLYAIWEENRQRFTLVFDANGGEGTMQNVQFAESVRLPECSFTRTGYDFVGWALSASSTSADYNAGDVFYRLSNPSTTLYAIWAPKTFTISFNTDGGSAVAPITAEYGATVAAPTAPTKSGYDFAGWSPAFPSTMPAENLTLTAQWTPKRYTITFNTNGGSSVSSVTYNYGAKITAPTAPTKTGHTFAGWSPALPSTMPAENLNVTAQWTVNEYTITFNTDGGSAISPLTVAYGATVTAPANPTKTGYEFTGWNPALPTTMPAKNVSVTAQWVKSNKKVLTFNTNGGSEISPQYYNPGDTVVAPANPTREGYTFTGWNPAIPSTMPNSDFEVTAQWKVNQYTLSFDTDGGTPIAPITLDYGATVIAPANPTKEGCTFAGWDEEIPGTMPAENLTFVAEWQPLPFTVTINSNGGSAIEPFTVYYGQELILPVPVYEGYELAGWEEEVPETMPAHNLSFTAKWATAKMSVSDYIKTKHNGGALARVYGTIVCFGRNESERRIAIIMDEQTTQTIMVRFALADCTFSDTDHTLTANGVTFAIGDTLIAQGTWASSMLWTTDYLSEVQKGTETHKVDYSKYNAITLATDQDYADFAKVYSSHMGELIKVVKPGASTSSSSAEGNYMRFYAEGQNIKNYAVDSSTSKYYCCYLVGLKENGTYNWYTEKYGDLVKFKAGETPTAFTATVFYAYVVSYGNTTIVCTIPSMDAVYTVQSAQITFNANGGQGTMSAQNIQTGIDVTINSCLFTREGYSFSGWSTQSSGEIEYADCATATFAKSTTLYAIWREKGEEDKIAECISAIADLGTSDFDANAVASARAMFNALPSNNARSKVTNYPALLDAEYHIATDAAYEAAKDDVQGVIKAVAYSYYNQTSSGNVQAYYDQYNSRRNFNPVPEDATPEKALYIDCSSFVNAVYYYTFNSNLLPAGTAINTSNVDKALASITDKGTEYELLYYVKNPPSTVKSADRAAMIADIKANLQVGDVYNYYHGTGGHIMLYIGDGKFMHCTGSANKSTSAGNVDPATSVEQGTTDENKLGSVMIDSWDIVFTSTATPKSTDPTKTGTGNRYLFGNTMTSFGFFRPTNKTNGRFKDTPITQRALTRYVYNGLTFEKVCNKAFSSSVLVGDELTYTLTLKNLSANAQGLINVTEPLPAGVEFVSANEGGVYNSTTNTIYWQFSGLDANSSKSIVYKFKVSSDTKVGTLINDNGTTVNGLLANSTQQTVASRKLTESELSNAVSALSSQTFDVDLDAAKALYAELGLKVFSETSAASFSVVLGQVLSSFKPTKSNKMYNYVVPALYGGFSVGSTEYTSTLSNSKYQDYNYRARLVKTSFLEVGDIIVTRSGWTADIEAGTDYKMFIYASSSTVYGLTADGHLAKVSLPNEAKLATYLQTLTAYKVFAVFRPIISTSAKAI